MTISNRQAGEQGKLGGDVLALAGPEKRADDTGDGLGFNPAPGLVSGLAAKDEPVDALLTDHVIPDYERQAYRPTMRAECSASDLIEGEQDRTSSPSDADCGPSYKRPVSPAIQAMIDAGYAVDPELL